jgi:hypothetical protein
MAWRLQASRVDSKRETALTEPLARRAGGRIAADVEAPPCPPGTRAYDAWVLDEAIEESFPASDPLIPAQPGSNIARRYAVAPRRAAAAAPLAWMVAIAAVTAACFLAARARRS